jgi:lipoprotein-anchoring transpeptidase ErfK/SrfK
MKTKKRIMHTPKIVEAAITKGARRSHKKIYVALAVVILILAVSGGLVWFFNDRALPNVSVGSVQVGGQQPAAVRAAIAQQAPALSITFDDNGKKTTVPAKDLGVVVDIEATVQNVLKARRDGNAMLWQDVTVPLVLANDPGVLIQYAKQHFPTAFVDAKDPQIVFDDQANTFVVQPGAVGKGLDIKSFERSLPDLAKHPQGFTLKLTTLEVQPLLDQSKLESVKNDANNRIAQKIEFTLSGSVIYTASKADIAGCIHFMPDTTKGTVTLQIEQAAVQQFINDKVGPTVAAPPIDRKVVVDSDSGVQTVIRQGSAGSQIKDADTLAGEVLAALNAGQSLSKEVSITTAPFKTVTMSGTGKWIEVDLSKQQLTMWLGSTVVLQTLISSGRAATPTEVGEFAIYSKTPMTTMTGTILGEYYYVPDIPWVSYFDSGEAFHGTYWHHNFGHPMSHGCINMTIADAKTLYDFAPIGTKVIVHY